MLAGTFQDCLEVMTFTDGKILARPASDHTPGAHPITSIGELRSDAFETDELDEFLAFVTESRHADPA